MNYSGIQLKSLAIGGFPDPPYFVNHALLSETASSLNAIIVPTSLYRRICFAFTYHSSGWKRIARTSMLDVTDVSYIPVACDHLHSRRKPIWFLVLRSMYRPTLMHSTSHQEDQPMLHHHLLPFASTRPPRPLPSPPRSGFSLCLVRNRSQWLDCMLSWQDTRVLLQDMRLGSQKSLLDQRARSPGLPKCSGVLWRSLG